ncbi:unnamed protein product, partial [Sphacelaria rigidula]
FFVPASSAVLERDFSADGRLITDSRSHMDSNFVQMIISLNGSRDVIPEEISVLTDSHAKDALP